MIRQIKLETILIFAILLLGAFVRFYKLNTLAPFIGDQGWFYISARDIVLGKSFPLVGIASSHPWLNQGPFWTYILAALLWIFKFNPLSGAYFVAFFGVITIYLLYKVSCELFGINVALVTAFLYATSPLVVIHSRISFHTSLIPLFTIIFLFFLNRFYRGNYSLLPLLVSMLAILYNFELATQAMWGVAGIIIGAMWFQDKTVIGKIFNKKNVLLSLASIIVIMMPVIIYDLNHNFMQTAGFLLWIPYKIFQFATRFLTGTTGFSAPKEFINFFFIFSGRLIFLQNSAVGFLIMGSSALYFFFRFCKKLKRNIHQRTPEFILAVAFFIPVAGLIISQTPSEAYLPMLFPTATMIISWCIYNVLKNKFIIMGVILLISAINTFALIQNNYLMNIKVGYGLSIQERLKASKHIIELSSKKPYNLIGKGSGSEFRSFTMNYEYLTWWLGYGPLKKQVSQKIYITEDNTRISIYK